MSTEDDESGETASQGEQETPDGEESVSNREETPDGEGVTAGDGTAGQGTAETADDSVVSGQRLYVGIGILSAVVAWVLIPLFGVVTMYAGYRLYDSESRNISTGVFVTLGALPLVFWALFLVQTA